MMCDSKVWGSSEIGREEVLSQGVRTRAFCENGAQGRADLIEDAISEVSEVYLQR